MPEKIEKPVRIVKATKKEAQALTLKVSKTWQSMERSWFRLGRLVDMCLERRVPEMMGMNAQAWMEKFLPGSTSKAWRALRITRALKGLPENKLEQVSEGNAFSLARLPEKMRKSTEWLDKAAKTSNDEFTEEVASALEKKGIRREVFVTMRISLPEDVYKLWEQAQAKIAEALEVDIQSQPGNRIKVIEFIAGLVNGLTPETLKAAAEGRNRE